MKNSIAFPLRHRSLTLVIASMICLPVLAQESEEVQQEETAAPPVRHLNSVTVIAAPEHSPLEITLDPKLPRQPVPAADATDYLKTVPGFAAVRTGGANADIIFRGMFGSRLNILTNDGNVYGGCGGRMDSPASYINPAAYDEVSITKGPQTVLWGGGAYAATIRFDRKPPAFDETPGAHFNGYGLVGSRGRVDTFIDASTGTDKAYARMIGYRGRSDDYKDGDGDTVPSKWYKWSVEAITGLRPDENTLLELTAGRSDGYARYADRTMDGTKFAKENVSLKFSKKHLGGALHGLEVESYYNHVDHVMDNFRLRPSSGMARANNPSRRVVGGRIQTDWLLGDNHSLSAGLDTQYDLHRSRNGIDRHSHPWGSNLRFVRHGLFGELTSAISDTDNLIYGVRFDFMRATDFRKTSATHDKRRSKTLPSIFARWEHTSTGLPLLSYVGLGYTERFPDFWEMNQNTVINSSSNAFDVLKPEKTLQLDIGTQYQTERTQVWASAYAGIIRDYILFNYTDTSKTQVDNVKVRTLGGELGWNQQLTNRFALESSLSYAWGKNSSYDRPMAQTPPLETRLHLKYQQEKWQAGLLWRLVAAQKRIDKNMGNVKGRDFDKSSGFSVFSANMSYDLLPAAKLSGGIDNLFDRKYSEHLNMAGSALWGLAANSRINEPGRTWWARLNVKF